MSRLGRFVESDMGSNGTFIYVDTDGNDNKVTWRKLGSKSIYFSLKLFNKNIEDTLALNGLSCEQTITDYLHTIDR